MAEASILPRPFVVLGDALRPILRRTANRMKAPLRQTRHGVDIFEFAPRHFGMIADDVEKLEDEITGALGPAMAVETSDADIWRVAARIEVHIERVLDGFDEVRRVQPDLADAAAFSLLGEIYCDLLEQIQSWLIEILDVVDDPLAALRKRGLATKGKVDLSIRLAVELPPQVERLQRCLEQRSRDHAASMRRQVEAEECAKSNGYGLLALVLAAFGLGWILGGDGDE